MEKGTKNLKLFLIVLGGKPEGRNIEQHDVCFGVGENVEELIPLMKRHWPIKLHLDSYTAVEEVDGFRVKIGPEKPPTQDEKLFFINLGGYKPNDLEEYHKKLVIAAKDLDEAKKIAKQDGFFSEGLTDPDTMTHIDDRMTLFGFDVDDAMLLNEILEPTHFIVLERDPLARFAHNPKTPGYRPL